MGQHTILLVQIKTDKVEGYQPGDRVRLTRAQLNELAKQHELKVIDDYALRGTDVVGPPPQEPQLVHRVAQQQDAS